MTCHWDTVGWAMPRAAAEVACWALTSDLAGVLVSEGTGLVWGLPRQHGNAECSSRGGPAEIF